MQDIHRPVSAAFILIGQNFARQVRDHLASMHRLKRDDILILISYDPRIGIAAQAEVTLQHLPEFVGRLIVVGLLLDQRVDGYVNGLLATCRCFDMQPERKTRYKIRQNSNTGINSAERDGSFRADNLPGINSESERFNSSLSRIRQIMRKTCLTTLQPSAFSAITAAEESVDPSGHITRSTPRWQFVAPVYVPRCSPK